MTTDWPSESPLTHLTEIDPILRMPDVMRGTGLRRGIIYRMIKRGEFPRPYRLTSRSSGWRASEIRAWIDALPRTLPEGQRKRVGAGASSASTAQ